MMFKIERPTAARPPIKSPAQLNAQRFTELDANKDGILSKDEFKPTPSDKFNEGAFKNLDRNQDGKVDREEFKKLTISMGPVRPIGGPVGGFPFLPFLGNPLENLKELGSKAWDIVSAPFKLFSSL